MTEKTPIPKTVSGRRLVPDMTAPKITKRTKYWFGLLPGSPVDPIHVAGVTFAKVMEIVQTGPGGETIRSPMLGVCSGLSRGQIERVIERIPRMVLRFHERIISDNQIDDDGKAMDAETMRVGHLVSIPSDDEAELLRKAGTFRPYTPGPDDVPVADFCFMVKQDMRGTEYPAPMSETGIEMPEE